MSDNNVTGTRMPTQGDDSVLNDALYKSFQPDDHKLNERGRELVDSGYERTETDISPHVRRYYLSNEEKGESIALTDEFRADQAGTIMMLFTRKLDGDERGTILWTNKELYVNGGLHYTVQPDGSLQSTGTANASG